MLVQWPHFFAATGIAIAHSGQSRVVTGVGGFGNHLFTARAIKKITKATIRKLISVLMKFP
jgi:hypothetical protein